MNSEAMPVIGPVSVRTDIAAVEAFSRSIGNPHGAEQALLVPHTFPMSWLDLEEVKEALFSGPEQVLQTFQTISYERPLQVDTGYEMTIRFVNGRNADSIRLETKVAERNGDLVVSMTSHVVKRRRLDGAPA